MNLFSSLLEMGELLESMPKRGEVVIPAHLYDKLNAAGIDVEAEVSKYYNADVFVSREIDE